MMSNLAVASFVAHALVSQRCNPHLTQSHKVFPFPPVFWNVFCYLLNYIVITEHTLYDFESSKSVKVCFIMQDILMKILCVPEKNVYPVTIRCHGLKTIRPSRLMVQFSSTYLPIFCLFVLPIAERGLLNSSTVIGKLSFSLFNSICFSPSCISVFCCQQQNIQNWQVFLVN